MNPNHAEIITPRFNLRILNKAVYDFAFTNFNKQQLLHFFGIETDEDLALEKERFEKGFETVNKSLFAFNIIDITTDENLGWCGYHTWYLTHNRAEIGYVITKPENRFKGIMKEVLPYVLNYGFEKLNLHRIEAFVGPANLASKKLLLNQGFLYEGLLKEHYLKDGIYGDSEIYGFLKH